MNIIHNVNFAFFGSSNFSVSTLDVFFDLGLIPKFIVTTSDKPQGRKMILTSNVVKKWAIDHNIPVYDPEKLDTGFIEKLINLQNSNSRCDVYVVASYGKIIPENIIDIPNRKTLNIHPSLLPKYRGPSPLPSQILDDEKNTGVTIMHLDNEMDHGPIVAQKNIIIPNWPIYEEFEKQMAIAGAKLLAEILEGWINGKITETAQNHSKATYTKKIVKSDGLLDFNSDAYANFRRIQAYHEWPQAYFFIKHNNRDIRVKITEAKFLNGKLEIQKVIPEGGKEMLYEDFRRGYLRDSTVGTEL